MNGFQRLLVQTLVEAVEHTHETEIKKGKSVIIKNPNTVHEYFLWNFEGLDLKLFKNAKYNDVIRSNRFNVKGCTAYLECTPNGWGGHGGCAVWVAFDLDKLPKDIHKIKVKFTYKCNAVGFNATRIQMIEKQVNYSMTTEERSEFSSYKTLKSVIFELHIDVINYYDKNNKVVKFQPTKYKIPAKIMFADSDRQYILVNFHSEADVNSFKRAKPKSVLETQLFDIDGCTFYFEITPNGWEGTKVVNVWCALKSLPDNIGAVEVYFQCKCNQVSFSADRTQTLALNADVPNIAFFWSATTERGMRCEPFMKLISWSFICKVNIMKWYDKNGKEISKNYAVKDDAKSDNQSQQTIDDLLNEQTKLINKNENFVSQITQLNTKIKLLEKSKTQHKQTEAEYNVLTEYVSQLEAENDKLKKENSNLNEECQEYQLQLKDIKSKYDQLYRKHNKNGSQRIENWSNEDLLKWVKTIGLKSAWEDTMTQAITSKKCTGKDWLRVQNYRNLATLLAIKQTMLANKVFREFKKVKQAETEDHGDNDNQLPSQRRIAYSWENKDINKWTYKELQEWICSLNLQKIIEKKVVDAIKEQGITGEDFDSLTNVGEVQDSFEIQKTAANKIYVAMKKISK